LIRLVGTDITPGHTTARGAVGEVGIGRYMVSDPAATSDVLLFNRQSR
jgi:hypothetical protein